MEKADNNRIDKFLWAVRLFKTRSVATEAIKKNRVLIGGQVIKNSRIVKHGDIIEIKNPPIIRRFEVLQLASSRMGAKLVPDFIRDITPADQLELMAIERMSRNLQRDRGTGRPTKKDRRDLDELFDSSDEDWELDEF